jgi:hypothetical membrane protein
MMLAYGVIGAVLFRNKPSDWSLVVHSAIVAVIMLVASFWPGVSEYEFMSLVVFGIAGGAAGVAVSTAIKISLKIYRESRQ